MSSTEVEFKESLRAQALAQSMNNPTATAKPPEMTQIESDEESGHDNNGKGPGGSLRASQQMTHRTKIFIVLVACVAAFGGLIFGYDIGK